MSALAMLDKDGDGDIDSDEWAAGYAQLGASAPGVPNPAVWYGTLPSGPSFSISQTGMDTMYAAPTQLKEEKEYRNQRPGVMVGYTGHVPRARDKVGGSPLGNLPGTPVSPNGKVGIDMEAMMSGVFKRELPEGREKTFAQIDIKEGYTPEGRDQGAAGQVKPTLYDDVRMRAQHHHAYCALCQRPRFAMITARASSRGMVATNEVPSSPTARRSTRTASPTTLGWVSTDGMMQSTT